MLATTTVEERTELVKGFYRECKDRNASVKAAFQKYDITIMEAQRKGRFLLHQSPI